MSRNERPAEHHEQRPSSKNVLIGQEAVVAAKIAEALGDRKTHNQQLEIAQRSLTLLDRSATIDGKATNPGTYRRLSQ